MYISISLSLSLSIYISMCTYIYIHMHTLAVGVGYHHPPIQWPNTPMDKCQQGNLGAVACLGWFRLPWLLIGLSCSNFVANPMYFGACCTCTLHLMLEHGAASSFLLSVDLARQRA